MSVGRDLGVSVAPVVGGGDPRRFTDSGIEVGDVYGCGDVAPGLSGGLVSLGSFRLRVVRIVGCIGSGCGRCVSTRGMRRRGSPMSVIAI